ncbi:unnamed protein product [Ceutorhynchus assimilis]|uniref:Uncharacterized protein n=1 Tax=Ceutorhynchus assimilis TaxID=467358 RepID=A0A9N9QTA3_9CUCU|nr:unnamed protein product [Ceutorhynchus assimilis]
MGLCIGKLQLDFCSCCPKKQKPVPKIISENSLEVITEIVYALRENARLYRNFGWFCLLQVRESDGHLNLEMANQILTMIENGSAPANRMISAWNREAAFALYQYLRANQPLIPESIQSIVLDNNNCNINPEIVAADVLGLIDEELHHRQKTLLWLLFQLFDCGIKVSPADELGGNTWPVSTLPLFFNLEDHRYLNDWRRILMIFVEMIRQAPNTLDDVFNAQALRVN